MAYLATLHVVASAAPMRQAQGRVAVRCKTKNNLAAMHASPDNTFSSSTGFHPMVTVQAVAKSSVKGMRPSVHNREEMVASNVHGT